MKERPQRESDDDLNLLFPLSVIGAASQCALATSQLVACARVVAPTIQSPACREQLEAAAREVAKAVTTLVEVCNDASDNQELKGDLMAAAREVSRSLNDLLEHIKVCSRERAVRVHDENPMENVLVATDMLVSSTDPQEMIRQAKALGQATAELIKSIKGEAERTRRFRNSAPFVGRCEATRRRHCENGGSRAALR